MIGEPAREDLGAPPDEVLFYRRAHLEAQRVPWTPQPWAVVFSTRPVAYRLLRDHAEATGGIARAFLHSLADGDPVELFLATMAWGFGNTGYGPSRVAKMLATPDVEQKIARIVEVVQVQGAGLGWWALLEGHKIQSLGMAFGTKLLTFAGYSVSEPPRPLVLDARVRAGLQRLAGRTVPPAGQTVWRRHYLAYLELAETWGSWPGWDQGPEVVEFSLFGGPRPDPEDSARTDDDAQDGET
ncbi:MAG: hypothetical protein ACRDYC_06470 [Acidimicrobiales bacterium]